MSTGTKQIVTEKIGAITGKGVIKERGGGVDDGEILRATKPNKKPEQYLVNDGPT